MFDFIEGEIVDKNPASVVVKSGSWGFKVMISLNSFTQLPEVNSPVKLYLHLNFNATTGRESVDLYGFMTESERELFALLKSVSKVGAKLALTILSSAEPDRLREAIAENDLNYLLRIKGIGSKTAQRIIIELKDKVPPPAYVGRRDSDDAVLALTSLGYSREQSFKAVEKVLNEFPDIELEELIRRSLAKI
ncbi:MAG: Holliday junction branch migration protein RuvA [bacterium]